jgi:hypothetical protein
VPASADQSVPRTKLTRWVIVSAALLALLVLTLSASSIGHHHTGCTQSTCSICHLSHQAVDQERSGLPATDFEMVAIQIAPAESEYSPGPISRQIPARAPPTA